jgi:hypothetical protein
MATKKRAGASKALAGTDTTKFYDAKGGAMTTKQPAASFAGTQATRRAYLELHYDGGGPVIFEIEVFFIPVFPFTITGGTIKGSICNSPTWVVTGGTMGPALTIKGSNVCPSPNCASSITVVGKCECPPCFVGTYGFNGNSTAFGHTTLFLGYDLPR